MQPLRISGSIHVHIMYSLYICPYTRQCLMGVRAFALCACVCMWVGVCMHAYVLSIGERSTVMAASWYMGLVGAARGCVRASVQACVCACMCACVYMQEGLKYDVNCVIYGDSSGHTHAATHTHTHTHTHTRACALYRLPTLHMFIHIACSL